jgi:hypothetical protein
MTNKNRLLDIFCLLLGIRDVNLVAARAQALLAARGKTDLLPCLQE